MTNRPLPHHRINHPSVFEQINDFMGVHTECIYYRLERIAYELAFVADADTCVVTVRCGCGASASLLAFRGVGEEIEELTRAHDIPLRTRTAMAAEARTLIAR